MGRAQHYPILPPVAVLTTCTSISMSSKLNIMTSMGGECLDGAREDVEMLYWQRGQSETTTYAPLS